MSLQEYTRKRNFGKTAEPKASRGKQVGHRFVIQKHAASRLHYDFRLEINGVLKSWAVPKGVPFTKGEKRLAVQVEDHPVSYIDFEGTIPKGQYGGGTVMVWDKGSYTTDVKSSLHELEHGKLHFTLMGSKLHYSQFKDIARDDCPFVNLPEKRSGRFGAGVTAAEMKRCHWVEPQMVCQIKFSEWTRDGKLRQPVFLGLREDKDASEVIREKAA